MANDMTVGNTYVTHIYALRNRGWPPTVRWDPVARAKVARGIARMEQGNLAN
jgi:hypothetical protein